MISLAVVATASAGSFSVAVPPDKSTVESGLVNLVLRGDQGAFDDLRITVNDRQQDVSAASLNRHYACFSGIRLSSGLNRIRISGFKEGKKSGEINTQVFYRSDLSPNSGSAPPGFKRYLFHGGSSEQWCSSCHSLDFRKSAEGKSPDQSPCYACHRKILNDYKFVHGPAAVWSCLTCHDGKSGRPGLSAGQPDDKSCRDCHERSWDGRKHLHGPTAAGRCTTCHNPHASDKPFFLKADTGDLCTSCHEEVLSRPHILTSFSQQGGHPLSRSPDPFKPDRDFDCTSCHNPHAGDSPVFLNAYDDSRSMQHFCRSCHKM